MTFFRRSFLAGAFAVAAVAGTGCDFNLEDPNTVGQETAFSTRDGLFAAAQGLQELYAVQTLDNVVITPGITTRELAANTTFANLLDLEAGGTGLPTTNANVGGLFGQLYQLLGFAEDVGEGADRVDELTDDERAGIGALADFYRAVAIGTLAQNFEQVALEVDPETPGTYASNDAAFERAADLLEEAEAALTAAPDAAAAAPIAAGFDLLNTVRAYRARYELFAGNDQAAIDAADRVDDGATSVFSYTGEASNPLFDDLVDGTPSFISRDDLGLENVDADDARVAFYTTAVDSLSTNGFPVDIVAGFADDGAAAPLPAYLPGELDLIRAEASLNLGDTDAAIGFINAVRTKTADEDPFGVGAGLDAYDGAEDDASLRQEIFLQRSAELYLQGLRLVDSRRLGGQSVGSGAFERTRTFYPYPFQERNANPNTPADPAI